MMSSIDNLPEAPRDTWHKVNGTALARAVVTNEPLLTKCGKKMTRFNSTDETRARTTEMPDMPDCPECQAIADYQQALRGETVWPSWVEAEI